jgi:hypothetical protein
MRENDPNSASRTHLGLMRRTIQENTPRNREQFLAMNKLADCELWLKRSLANQDVD